jgi:hypothetical protein
MTNTTQEHKSLFKEALSKGVFFTLLVIPTVLAIIALLEVRTHPKASADQSILCLSADLCAIQVNDVWYTINDVIVMDELIPDKFIISPPNVVVITPAIGP